MAKYRRIARGVYTTAVKGEAVKGETIQLEKHWNAPRGRAPIQGQPYWWTWTIAGGHTDGIAYPTRGSAELAAQLWREGVVT